MWRRSQGTWLSPHTPTRASSSVRLCVCVYATGSGNRVCSSHVFFLTPQTERMPSYFCDKEGACVKTDFVDCENDRVCVNACVCYLRCLLWMWCHVFVMWGEGVFGFFPSKAQKKVLGFISVCFVKSALNIAEIKCSSHSLNKLHLSTWFIDWTDVICCSKGMIYLESWGPWCYAQSWNILNGKKHTKSTIPNKVLPVFISTLQLDPAVFFLSFYLFLLFSKDALNWPAIQ